MTLNVLSVVSLEIVGIEERSSFITKSTENLDSNLTLVVYTEGTPAIKKMYFIDSTKFIYYKYNNVDICII